MIRIGRILIIFDPESTLAEVRKCLPFSDMMGGWDTLGIFKVQV